MKVRNRPSQDGNGYLPANQSGNGGGSQRGSHEDRHSIHPLRQMEMDHSRDSDCGDRKNTWPRPSASAPTGQQLEEKRQYYEGAGDGGSAHGSRHGSATDLQQAAHGGSGGPAAKDRPSPHRPKKPKAPHNPHRTNSLRHPSRAVIGSLALCMLTAVYLDLDVATMLTLFLALFPVLLFVAYFSRLAIPSREMAVLRKVYSATGGPGWNRNYGWDELSGFFCDPASCHGLTIRDGHVVKIDLEKNNLQGVIPEEIGQLERLQVLKLGGNLLTGALPRSLGKCVSLTRCDLPHNMLQGSIPPSIGGCRRLEKLILSGNNLTGPIPPSIGKLKFLHALVLYGNELSGEIPECLGSFKYLHSFIANNNQLTGTVPKTLGDSKALTNFDVGANRIEGAVPASIGRCEALVTLYLYDNRLEGELPESIGRLRCLEHLDCSSNRISGACLRARRRRRRRRDVCVLRRRRMRAAALTGMAH